MASISDRIRPQFDFNPIFELRMQLRRINGWRSSQVCVWKLIDSIDLQILTNAPMNGAGNWSKISMASANLGGEANRSLAVNHSKATLMILRIDFPRTTWQIWQFHSSGIKSNASLMGTLHEPFSMKLSNDSTRPPTAMLGKAVAIRRLTWRPSPPGFSSQSPTHRPNNR